MRARVLMAFLMAALVFQAWPGTASQSAATGVGKFAVLCDFVASKSIDPITGSDASHQHEFFGSKSVSLGESVSDLRAAGTSCADTRDTASYWAPMLMVNGRLITSTGLGAYYSNGGKPASELHNLPLGLKLIAGNSHATKRQPLSVTWYNCSEGTTAANDRHRNYIP